MTEEFQSLSNDAPPVAAAPSSLRQAREAAGLPVGALAAMLKVPVERLQALEDGRYQDLPNLTFARALASSVCRALKIDPVPLLQSLPHAAEVKLGSDRPLEHATLSQRHMSLASTAAALPLRSPLLWALAVLVVAAVLWWWLPQKEAAAPVGQPTSAGPLAPAAETETPPVQIVPSAPVPAAPAVSEPQPPMPAPASAAVAQPPAEVAPAGVAAVVGQPVMRLSANQAVWVKVSGASRKQLLQRTLKAGETVEFNDDAPYAVVLGRVDAVQVVVRGEALDLSSYARNQIARFEVK